jgi:hypothetical protein
LVSQYTSIRLYYNQTNDSESENKNN